MRNLKLFLALSLLSLPAFAASEKVEVKVKGMVCSFCAQGIKKKFEGEKGVEHVKVDLDAKYVHFDLKTGEKIDDARVTELIKDAGYAVTSIERN